MPQYCGLYSGVEYQILEPDAMDDSINSFVTQNQKDRILSIFMLPGLMRELMYEDGYPREDIPTMDVTVDMQSDYIGSYSPRNKKLLCYPYNFMVVDTTTEAKEFRFEWFLNRTTSFKCYFLISPNPEAVICPVSYNGTAPNDFKSGVNFTENVKITGYPQCAMSIDSYAAWLAQNSGHVALSAAGAGAATVGGIMTGNAVGVLGGVGMMGKLIADEARESSKGSTSRGNICSSAIAAAGGLVIYFKKMGITVEAAMMLDDYFDRFGYVCNRVKVPTRNNRPHWTYLKTKDCTIHGGVPVEYAKKICEIYDRGITWWNMTGNGSTVGDYSQNNAPV